MSQTSNECFIFLYHFISNIYKVVTTTAEKDELNKERNQKKKTQTTWIDKFTHIPKSSIVAKAAPHPSWPYRCVGKDQSNFKLTFVCEGRLDLNVFTLWRASLFFYFPSLKSKTVYWCFQDRQRCLRTYW